MKKKTPKKSIMKYFEPIETGSKMMGDMSSLDLDGSFGYFTHAPSRDKLFLNRLSSMDILELLKKVGLAKHLAQKGFPDLLVDIDRDETLIHYLKIYHQEMIPDQLIIDLRVSESRFVPDRRFFRDDDGLQALDMIVIEWLSSQNPRDHFSSDKPQLPGQKRPGLGVLNFMMELMYIVGREVIKDGFLDIPDHFHGAVMYSRKFKFFDPVHEGILWAMMRDLKGYTLMDLSWGIITRTIIDKKTNMPQEYDPSEQIFPVSKRLMDYFKSREYKEKFRGVYKKKNFRFDYESMVRLREEMLRTKNLIDL